MKLIGGLPRIEDLDLTGKHIEGKDEMRFFFGGPWNNGRNVGPAPTIIHVDDNDTGFYERGYVSESIAVFSAYDWVAK